MANGGPTAGTVRTIPPGTTPTDRGSWLEKLQEYAHQLSVLKVVTYVGEATVDTDQNGIARAIRIPDTGKAIVTILDLVGGDITNIIHPEMVDDTALRDFHGSQVEKAAAVLPNNLKVLGEFIEKIF